MAKSFRFNLYEVYQTNNYKIKILICTDHLVTKKNNTPEIKKSYRVKSIPQVLNVTDLKVTY